MIVACHFGCVWVVFGAVEAWMVVCGLLLWRLRLELVVRWSRRIFGDGGLALVTLWRWQLRGKCVLTSYRKVISV